MNIREKKTFRPNILHKLNRQVIFHNQKSKIFQKFFLLHTIFFAGTFCNKNLWDRISKQIFPLLCWLSFHFSCQQTIHFLLKYLDNLTMIYINMYFSKCYSIGFIIWNWSFSRLYFWICGIYWIIMTKYTTHNLWILKINICIIINKI